MIMIEVNITSSASSYLQQVTLNFPDSCFNVTNRMGLPCEVLTVSMKTTLVNANSSYIMELTHQKALNFSYKNMMGLESKYT
jgi:hypothetical protein